MGCLKWILAYLFDCVHPHTTWPHRDRAGLAYVCCLDCGRELPYSLERMRIVTKRGGVGRSKPGAMAAPDDHRLKAGRRTRQLGG